MRLFTLKSGLHLEIDDGWRATINVITSKPTSHSLVAIFQQQI